MIARRLGRALLRRCPNCGRSEVFRSWARLLTECPQCHLEYEREEGYWLGAILINTSITMIVFLGTMLLWARATWPDPPWVTMTVTGIAINLVFPIAFYPLSKTLWVALEITARPPT